MNIGLVIGKKRSTGIPGKNIKTIVGRPAAEYAFIAAKHSIIDKIFVSTDCEEIQAIGKNYSAIHIARPDYLARPDSLTEDVLVHAYSEILKHIPAPEIKTISLLFCNNPAVDVAKLNEAIAFTATTTEYDSCFSVARYDMFSPIRARKLSDKGEIVSAAPDLLKDGISSIRSSQGAIYFCDLSIQVMKPRCFTHMSEGQQPFQWQGRSSKAIEVDYGFDIDSEWQFVVIEHWLRSRGFTETTIPWVQG